jgi:hypothetical protein
MQILMVVDQTRHWEKCVRGNINGSEARIITEYIEGYRRSGPGSARTLL